MIDFKKLNFKTADNKRYFIKFLFLVLIILGVIILTIKYAPIITKLTDSNYRMQFKDEISQMGIRGVFVILGLQILQTIVAILPGQPIELIAGMLYGPFWGTIVCVSGIFISVLSIFFMVRRCGIEFIKLFFSEEKINKIKESKLFKNSSKFELVLFIVFLLPIFPKDIFIYIAGISPIKSSKFIALATLARIPGQWLGVYTGSKIIQGSYLMPIIIFALFGILGILFILFSKRLNGEKYKDFKDII